MEEKDLSHQIGTEGNPIVVKPENPYEKPEIKVSWLAPSRVFKSRQPTWFIGVVILCFMVGFLLILARQWTLMIAVIAFTFVLLTMDLVEPEGREYAITTYGIKIGKKHTKFYDLKWFWFEKDSQTYILYISTYLSMPHVLEIPLPLENTEIIREKIENELLKHIPYHEEGSRNYLNTFDNIVSYIEPWIPKFLVNFYTRLFHHS